MEQESQATGPAMAGVGGGASWQARVPAGMLGGAFLLLWCTGYPAARIALDYAAPFTVLTLRFGIAGLIYAALAQQAGVWPRGRALLHSAVVGALSLALTFGALYLSAAQGVNVGICALVIGTMPIVTALMGLPFGETVRPLQWAGFALGFTGVALSVGESLGAGRVAAPASAYVALALGLLGVSAGTLYQKRLGSEVDLRGGLAVQHLVATALLAPFALAAGVHADASLALAASLGWLVAVNSLVAFALLFVLLKRGAVSRVSTLFFLMPPVTAVLDFFVLGDALSALKVAGLAIAAAGVWPRGRALLHSAVVGALSLAL
ncbi:MAG TPA: EamA family transporter, partial [Steroidobacteraceae bacterium]|nr:EamA family transporter [Steroidobacteraceae bacterium]